MALTPRNPASNAITLMRLLYLKRLADYVQRCEAFFQTVASTATGADPGS